MTLDRPVTVLWYKVASSFKLKFLSFLLIVNVCCKAVSGSDSESQESFSSSVPRGSITYNNKYLAGHVRHRLHIDDWLACLSACASAEDCISYNFHPKLGTCELNGGGIAELGSECQGEKSLMFSQGSIFQQIRGN